MRGEHQILKAVYAAREDSQKADELIRTYIPFIRSEASKYLSRLCTEQDDEYSIAMMAFYEAVMGYEGGRGAFLSYAALLIRSRLIDYTRKEARHQGHLSLHEPNGEEDDRTLMESLADARDYYTESAHREATRQEILELSDVMALFGIGFSEVADNSPRQERTQEACARVIRYASANPHLLEQLLRTRKLPLQELVSGAGVDRKTLERHRKYLLAMLLIQTNGYEIIRGHLYRILKKGAAAV